MVERQLPKLHTRVRSPSPAPKSSHQVVDHIKSWATILPATRYPLPATRYPLPATRYPLPATRYPLLQRHIWHNDSLVMHNDFSDEPDRDAVCD